MKSKSKLGALFYSNKFLAVFSVIAAVIIWLVITVEFSPETTAVIANVPVNIDTTALDSLGLKSYTDTDFTVNVTISGKKYIVTSKDYQDRVSVNANVGPVTTSGEYELNLETSVSGNADLFTVVGLSQNKIEVFFDYEDKMEFKVEVKNDSLDSVTADGYEAGEFALDYPTVQIKGARSEINKIDRVIARVSLSNLTESVTESVAVSPVTKDGSSLNYVTYNHDTVNVKLPIYKRITLKNTVGFTGKPSGRFEGFPAKVSPAQTTYGIPTDALDSNATDFVVASIDFSQLQPGENKFKIKADSISSAKVLDGTTEFTVTVKVDNMDLVFVPVSEVECINVPDGVNAQAVLNFNEVTVVGPKNSISDISSSDISLTVDMTDVDPEGEKTLILPVAFAGTDYWIYGDYTATVTLN
ncbi:MAG: hypothetical protein K6F64_05565 [Clostridia bacterium]|nr:hypothetical protein [Clostridia bacterium]